MNSFTQIIDLLKQFFVWFFVVEPWEKAIRVRGGKKTEVLGGGFHVRIPVWDIVYIHNTRRMVSYTSTQTVSSKDGKVYSLSASISYEITDVLKLHTGAHHAHGVVAQRACQAIASCVQGNVKADITPQLVSDAVNAVNYADLGIGNVVACVENFAIVSTYRLINEGMSSFNQWADNLSTQNKKK